MRIQLWSIGKAHDSSTRAAIDDFTKRASRYYPCEWKLINSPKITEPNALKKAEGQLILGALQKDDYLVLLDERGKQISSPELAMLLQQRANESTRTLVFLIGGAFGVDAAVQQRANFSWSLSKLVFPHQIVRLVLAEQVYRACTILRNEKYHHE
ncbi:23S rRNA (pseudouridine(1915)-N(3))-methyltransferase RlmH [Flavihumibacter rivuli]|uniref:23S rRNA (pseudouridine(1915)-N(3))-methyltransferase RlmH n=1 Tax=Flavihumibacter rivuli TaxID=2838156 RepID=UPI001BDF426E|nr:23S rRNA (pseudouridine(1915)-N(3))-methyltransferase RlmH [Flavihumibacter rivuli]ULQ57404.1 23S rRNA (pseudouridine(1915)-N(3))-methyltransferase RlmH [Flavihumibacter rivuli]